VKNVTGYDLPKLIAGSWGRLAAITEVTLKVLPAPRVRTTLVLAGLEPLRAAAAMAEAMGSQAEPAAAAHLPRAAGPLTAFRIQGFHASVAARARGLAERLETYGAVRQAEAEEAEDLWRNLGTLSSLPADWPLWRVNVPPSAGAALTSALESHGAQWLLDWAGGLAWIAFDGDPEMVRAQARLAGGHAMLVRGGEMRAQVSAFHPPEPGVARLEARIRRAFDPQGVFETGRF
jgi:glycolate oxidase FAD binding subunit